MFGILDNHSTPIESTKPLKINKIKTLLQLVPTYQKAAYNQPILRESLLAISPA